MRRTPTRTYFAIALLAMAATAEGQYLETTIPVGDTPLDLLWNPAGNKVYCTNEQSDEVHVIAGATNEVLAVIDVHEFPTTLCWNSHENKIYCTSSEANRLEVIDGNGDSLIKSLRVGDGPVHMAYNATMNKLYVGCTDNDRIAVLDAGPDTLIASIDVSDAHGLLWHPVTNRVFCYTDTDADTMKVIDCTTDEVVVRMPLPTGLRSLGTWCYNPVNDLVYLTSRYTIYVFTPEGDSVVAEVPGWPYAICSAPYPNKLYVAGEAGIRVVDCNTHVVVETIPGIAGRLLCDTVLGNVYCSSLSEKAYVLDARADTLVESIPLGRYPYALCWNRTDSRVYIADQMDDVVYVVRDTTAGIAEQEFYAGRARPLASMLVSCSYFCSEGERTVLVDACGRSAGALEPGLNDLSSLALGVYLAVSSDGEVKQRLLKVR